MPVLGNHLMQYQQISGNHTYPHPLGTRLFETPLQFSAIGFTHFRDSHTSQLLAEPLLDTFIFVITKQKSASKSPVHPLIFVYLLQSNFLPISLKDVYLKKNKGSKSLANHLSISHSSHFIGKMRKHSRSLRQLFS